MPAPLTEEQFMRLLGKCSRERHDRVLKLASDIRTLEPKARTSRLIGNAEMERILIETMFDRAAEIERILLCDPGVPEIPAPPHGVLVSQRAVHA